MRERKEVGLPGGHSCCNKNFLILPTSDLYWPADDVNENHNYTACLFLQTAHSDSSFHCRNCFLEQKIKNSKKLIFYVETKVEVSGELKFKTRKDIMS